MYASILKRLMGNTLFSHLRGSVQPNRFFVSAFLAAACANVNSRQRSIGIAASFPTVSESGRFGDRDDLSKVYTHLSLYVQPLNFFLFQGVLLLEGGLAAHLPSAMCSKRHTYYPSMGHLCNKIMAASPAAGKTPGSRGIYGRQQI